MQKKMFHKFIRAYWKMFVLIIISILLGLASIVFCFYPFLNAGGFSFSGFELAFSNPISILMTFAFIFLCLALVFNVIFLFVFFFSRKNGPLQFIIFLLGTLFFLAVSFLIFYETDYFTAQNGVASSLTIFSIMSAVFTLIAFVLNSIALLYVSFNKDKPTVDIHEKEDIDI